LKTHYNNTNFQNHIIGEQNMNHFRNFFATVILFSTLFAGQDLTSAKIRINENDLKGAESFLLKALDHPKDKWEAAFHLGDKVYPNQKEWGLVKKYMDIALTSPKSLKIRPSKNDRKVAMNTAVENSLINSYNIIYQDASGYLSKLNSFQTEKERFELINEAINLCIVGINLSSNQPGLYALASIYSSVKGDKEATNKYINQALAITDLTKETKIAILMSGGQSFVRIGEFNEALNFYNQALKINPKEPSVLESLGSLYLAQSKYDLALQYLNEALDISTDDKKRVDLFFNRGLVYLKMKNFDEAEYNFEEAYFLAPEDLEALLGLAQALEEAERWRKARNYYMELIDQNPNDPQYYYGVYRTYFGEGRLEDAQEYLNKATALKSN
jgi:tetratricopeptide (TPR) repeat protein